MGGVSLVSIRARVERLVSASLPSPEPLIVHWKLPPERCPSCGAELEAYARAALAEALDAHANDERPLRMLWAGLTTCPQCGATLPS